MRKLQQSLYIEVEYTNRTHRLPLSLLSPATRNRLFKAQHLEKVAFRERAMKFNIVISATIFLLVAGCGEMRTPIDLESGSDSDATTNLETDCGDGVIQLGEACDGLNVGAMRCEYLGLGAGELNCASTASTSTSLRVVSQPLETRTTIITRASVAGSRMAGATPKTT